MVVVVAAAVVVGDWVVVGAAVVTVGSAAEVVVVAAAASTVPCVVEVGSLSVVVSVPPHAAAIITNASVAAVCFTSTSLARSRSVSGPRSGRSAYRIHSRGSRESSRAELLAVWGGACNVSSTWAIRHPPVGARGGDGCRNHHRRPRRGRARKPDQPGLVRPRARRRHGPRRRTGPRPWAPPSGVSLDEQRLLAVATLGQLRSGHEYASEFASVSDARPTTSGVSL